MTAIDKHTGEGTRESLSGSPGVLQWGMWCAWALFVLNIAYAAVIVASGAFSGAGADPYWAIGEILTIVGAPIQVTLFALIHECAPQRAKTLSLTAFGWMLAWASLTVTVHFVELTVSRRIDLAANPVLANVFGFARPSLVMGVELVAWHFFLGLSQLFAAAAFRGRGIEASVRVGLVLGGVLCLAGLLGPAIGNPYVRLIGVLGYGVVLPVVILMIGFVFRKARPRRTQLPQSGDAVGSEGSK